MSSFVFAGDVPAGSIEIKRISLFIYFLVAFFWSPLSSLWFDKKAENGRRKGAPFSQSYAHRSTKERSRQKKVDGCKATHDGGIASGKNGWMRSSRRGKKKRDERGGSRPNDDRLQKEVKLIKN
jgi:hypothetical protein